MDTLRNLLESHFITPETLITIHIPPRLKGVSGYMLTGHFSDDYIRKYYDRPYKSMDFEADSNFLEVRLT